MKLKAHMRIRACLFLVVTPCIVVPAHGQKKNALVLVRTIALPEVQSGFNHMSVDAEHQRLFATAPTNKTLEIVDLKSGRPWRSLEGERPTAARYAPEFNQLYVTSGQNVYIYDGSDFGLIARINVHSRLDELQYDGHAKQLYVGCMTAGRTGIAVIAIPERKLLGKIPLPASPQGIAVEERGRRIYASVPAANCIEVIDRSERKIMAVWQLEGAPDNFPIVLDEGDQRLFVSCRQPAEVLVLDTQSGKIIARAPCVGGADDMWYDSARKRIYVSGSQGFISIIEQQDADHYRLRERVATAARAATSAFSSELNSLCVGVPRRSNEAAEIRVYKAANLAATHWPRRSEGPVLIRRLRPIVISALSPNK
jgi:hypothetical protein